MYNGLEWLKLNLPWKGQTLQKCIKSKSEMKDAILSGKESKYNFKNVPKSNYSKLLFKFGSFKIV